MMDLNGLKILHVFDHSVPVHSGYSFRSAALLREQRARGWATCHITAPRHAISGPMYENVDGLAFYRTPRSHRRLFANSIVTEIAQIRAVARRIEEVARIEAPQLLHAHSPVLNALSCLIAARRLRLPVIYEVRAFWEDAAVSHGSASATRARYKTTRAIETFVLKKSNAVVTICDGLRKDIISRGIPPQAVTIVANGVDLEAFAPRARQNLDLVNKLNLEGKVVLGFFGSFYEYEGLEDLLAALRVVHTESPKTVLLLAGGGPCEEGLKHQARNMGIEQAVRFIGRIPHHEVADYYALVDMFVYPRRPMRLTEIVTPLKPLEAMASGGIVVASDVGGHRELITDQVSGHLYRAGNVSLLAQTLLKVIAAQDEWPRMRANARNFVQRERGWPITTAGYEAAYAHALEHHRYRA